MLTDRTRKKLEEERQDVLDNIRYERWEFELMVQRAQATGHSLNVDLLNAVTERFAEFEKQAIEAKNIGEFDHLIEKAEEQGTLRAYISPAKEVENEGRLSIDVMTEWGIPKVTIEGLRTTLGQQLRNTDPDTARSALR